MLFPFQETYFFAFPGRQNTLCSMSRGIARPRLGSGVSFAHRLDIVRRQFRTVRLSPRGIELITDRYGGDCPGLLFLQLDNSRLSTRVSAWLYGLDPSESWTLTFQETDFIDVGQV